MSFKSLTTTLLDGIPFAINPLFTPNTKLDSKISDYNFSRLNRVLDFEYDCKTEIDVLNKDIINNSEETLEESDDLKTKSLTPPLATPSTDTNGYIFHQPKYTTTTTTTTTSASNHDLIYSTSPANSVYKFNYNTNPFNNNKYATSTTTTLNDYAPSFLSQQLPRQTTPISIPAVATTTTLGVQYTTNSPVHFTSTELLVPTRKIDVEPNKNNNTSKTIMNNNLGKNETSFKNIVNNNSVNTNSKYDSFFDNSTLDPFHEMELRTINDKEELKNILEKQTTYFQSNASASTVAAQSTLINSNLEQNSDFYLQQQQQQTTKNGTNYLDNYGLPKVSFTNTDINSNDLKIVNSSK